MQAIYGRRMQASKTVQASGMEPLAAGQATKPSASASSTGAASADTSTENNLRMFQCYYTPFWVCDNPDAKAIKPALIELVRRVQEHERGTSEASRSNRGGWRSNTIAINQPGLDALTPWLTKMFRQVVDTSYSYKLEPWLNVHYQHGFNVRHTHPGAALSGVYYISVPEGGGNLVLEDPRSEAVFSLFHRYFQYCKDKTISHGPIHIKPKEGRLVMFPAWFPHHVEASESAEPRISLPFNLVAKEKIQS